MRILSVSPYYSPEGGGLERYAHAILSRLASLGHEVHAMSFTRHAPFANMQDGVMVHRHSPMLNFGNTPVHPAFGSRIRRAIRSLRPELVLGHTPVPFPAEMAYGAARRHGVPFVATYHAGTLRGSTPMLNAFASLDRATFERRMLDGAAHLVAVSPYVAQNALRRHTDKTTVVPPGVDLGRFRPGRGLRRPEILFVGPLSRNYSWKGLDTLCKAFTLVRRHVPNASLRLVGSGDRLADFKVLEAASRGSLQVDARLTEDGLVEAYQRATVLALPSLTDAESFGMVLAEANACDTPVVASDIGGIPSFVRNGENGFLVKPGDEVELAARLTQLLQDPDLAKRMGQRGRQTVEQHHDWGHLTASVERVLRQVVADGPRRQTT